MIFEATVIVRTEDRYKAKAIVANHWGAVINNAHTSYQSTNNTEIGVVDWDLKTHPVKTIIK